MSSDAVERSESSQDPIERILGRCLAGSRAEIEAAIEQACADHPDLADELRERFDMLAASGLIEDTDHSPDSAFPDRLGEFRLIERIGGGGMGVVYRAEQEGLGREVALKLIRPEQMFFPGARSRFQREVESVARLQHPGIVPIYSVGEEQGIPFFAMELVRGCTLAEILVQLSTRVPASLRGDDCREVLRQRLGETEAAADESVDDLFEGSWPELCARLVRRIALAIEHAHRRGIRHRDLKPSNLMVTPSGRVLVLDFGLARAEGSARLTRTGSTLGSLGYMPPERLRKLEDDTDPRSDVYSLGVSLCEMLALELPFTGADESAMRAAIVHGTSEGPRRKNPAVPRDLETICLTAMDKSRERRYASMQELADELDRYLRREPIHARPAGVPLRAARWVQRNPTATLTLVLVALVFVVLPTGLFFHQRSVNKQITREKDRAERNFKRADKNYERAREAVERFLLRVASRDFEYLANSEQVRTHLLGDAVEFFEGFLAESDDGDDAELRWQKADALAQLTRVHGAMGHRSKALEYEGPARELLSALVAEFPNDARYRRSLASLENDVTTIYWNMGEFDESVAAAQRAVALLEPIRDLVTKNAVLGIALAQAYRVLASNLSSMQKMAEAEVAYNKTYELARQLHERWPNNAEASQPLASASQGLATFHQRTRKWDLVQKFTEEAVRVSREVRKRLPGSPHVQYTYVTNLLALANDCLRRGELAAAAENYRLTLVHFAELRATYPQTHWLRLEHGKVLVSVGKAYRRMGKRDDARELARRAHAVLDELGEREPENPRYVWELRRLHGLEASLAYDKRAWADVERHHAKAIELGETLVKVAPQVPEHHFRLSQDLNDLSIALRRQGRTKDSIDAVRRSIAIKEKLVETHPLIGYKQSLARSYHTLGMCEDLSGELEPALATYRKSIALKRQLLQAETAPTDLRSLGVTLQAQGICLLKLGKDDEARRSLEEAVTQTKAALAKVPVNPGYRRTLAEIYDNLGHIARRARQHAKMDELARAIADADPNNGSSLVLAAVLLLRKVPILKRDDALDAETKNRLTEAAIEQSMAWIRTAIARGYKNVRELRDNRWLAPLRKLPEFEALVAELEKRLRK